jgi:hypothetical protein
MPRLVRRKPLWERITSNLNPRDFSLWLSEEIETRDLDAKEVGTYFGLSLNFVFLLARGSAGATSTAGDDIFDDERSSGWVSFFVYPLVWSLVALSAANALYAVTRTRKYRLFEANVEVQPSTPSARRVRLESTPLTSSPLRFIADLITPESAESRAHPDKARDVWELSIWDPVPASLQLLCFFSPGHVLAYMIFLPLAPLDPRPSVTVFCTLVMQVVMTTQMLLLCSGFAQQAKDNAIIQKEVMHEYDTKFVHPRLHPVVRDVGTQISDDQLDNNQANVQVGTPTTLIRHAFLTHPNPNYVDQPELKTPSASYSHIMRTQTSTPPTATRPRDLSTPFTARRDLSSPLTTRRDSSTPFTASRSSAMRQSMPAGYTPSVDSTPGRETPGASETNYGGHLGVYSHAKSPLKKAVSYGDLSSPAPASPRNSREMAAYEQRTPGRPVSPTKPLNARHSIGTSMGYSTTSPGQLVRNRAAQQERYPSRW